MNTCTLNAARASAGVRRATVPLILCIDDDPDISHAVELHMRAFGVQVHRAFHGMQGFSEAIRVKPDLILLDLAMPNGDGLTILECIRRNPATRSIPAIVLTGMRDPKAAAGAFRAGANHVLRKPIHVDELTHQIARYIDVSDANAAANEGNTPP